MSEPAVTIPPWSLGWRLQRSLAWANVTTEAMAQHLGVARSTISRWCNDHGAPPRTIYVRAWAHRCRVPVDWLLYGEAQLPRVDSNHQPAGWSKDLETVAATVRHVAGDVVLTDRAVLAYQRAFRQEIRRGTLDQLAGGGSPDRPMAGHR